MKRNNFRKHRHLWLGGCLALFCATLINAAPAPSKSPGETGSPSPQAIGLRVASWSLSNLMQSLSYENVCTAYGILKMAAVTGDERLRTGIEEAFRPYLLEGANPNRDNAAKNPAHQWFGFIPLELYKQTKNVRYLQRGLELAELQYEGTDADGMPVYTSRWYVDDIYGATTMQSLAYACTHDPKYLERAVKQVLVYAEKFQEANGLFYHGPESKFFWGRGSGWCAAAFVELLNVLPASHPQREKVLSAYRRMMESLVTYQSKEGSWRQLVDDSSSWPESSCTGMFLFALSEGVKHGWLPKDKYAPAVEIAWPALTGYVDEIGRLQEVCVGTGRGKSIAYYLNRPRITGDPHGQAALLWAAASLSRTAAPARSSPSRRPSPVMKNADRFAPKSIHQLMVRVNGWQAAHPVMKPNDRNWERGTWYTGVMAAYKATGDEKFLQQAMEWGKQHQWQVGTEKQGANRLFCVETWAELYFIKKDKAMIAPAIEWLSTVASNSPAGAKVWHLEGGRRYADSLYGACALAMLAKATGDKKYLAYMNDFFWDVHAELFDKDDGLFYRDKRFIGQTTKNGKKVFWSRGNGWVLGGIVRVLEYLTEDDPQRPRYVELLRTMSAAIAKCQGADGLWRPNLADPDDVALPESSGTGFFCYGMAWGINHGLLDRSTYEPVVKKAWAGLVKSVSADGQVQWGQPVGDRPVNLQQTQTHEYVTGTFLLAGSEIYKLAREVDGDSGAGVMPIEVTNELNVTCINETIVDMGSVKNIQQTGKVLSGMSDHLPLFPDPQRGNRVFPASARVVGGGLIALPPPPDPPYDIETIEPTDVPPVSVWAGETEPPPAIWWECGAPVRPAPKHPELELDDGWILVLDGDTVPDDEWPVYAAN